MENNRKIQIAVAGSRKSTEWQTQNLYWSEMVEKLRFATRSSETLDEYLKYPKVKQDDLKDVGGFVGGTLRNNRRKAENIEGRDIITLDLDNIPSNMTDNVVQRVNGLGCSFAIYSTRKHEPSKPRLRVLAPLDRTVTPDEYEPIARKLASLIGIEFADPRPSNLTV